MNNISTLLGEKLRFYRIERELSQEQLAFKSQLTPSYIGQIERGEKSPTIKTLDKLITALDISYQDIFDLEFPSTSIVSNSVIEKITYHLSNRSLEEQEAIYNILKQILVFKDKY